MTQERIDDPCLEKEEIERPDPYAPEIPPEPRQLEVPSAAFPTRRSAVIETESIRSSALIDRYQMHLGEFSRANNLKLAEEALQVPEWQESPEIIDTFRFVAAANYDFANGNLRFIKTNSQVSSKSGVYFETKFSSTTANGVETSDVTLGFDKNVLQELLTVKGIVDVEPDKFIFGTVTGDESQGAGAVRLIPREFSEKHDTSFIAPAAFFESEAEQSTVPLVEVASFTPVVGSLPLEETDESELNKASIYRLYSSMLNDSNEITIPGDRTQVFSDDSVKKLSDINEQATNQLLESQLFIRSEAIRNNHIKFYFNTNHKSELCDILSEAGLASLFVDYVALNISDGNFGVGQIDPAEQKDLNYIQVLDQTEERTTFESMVTVNNRLVFDYDPNFYGGEEFMEKVFGNLDDTVEFMVASKEQHPIPYYENSPTERTIDIDQGFFSGIPESEVNRFIRSKKRTFQQILEGEPAYSEVVGYRVEKAALETGEVIQNFIFFNDQETNFIEFLDSQVCYNRSYHYRIYAINAVVGSKYYYKLSDRQYTLDDFTGPKPTYNFEVVNSAHLSFVETPYFEQELFMIDRPPIFPQVEVIPFFQNPRKIGFRMTPTYGKINERPIKILEEDQQVIDKMLLSQGSITEKIEFSGDSQPTQYEALLTEIEPFSYRDFSQAQRFVVDATFNSGYIEMSLIPNKRYYLVFRSIDLAGISNPSLAYTLVLNSHADGVFVEFNEFDLTGRILEQEITFEKTIKIDPALEQAGINFSNVIDDPDFYMSAPSVEELELGVIEEKLWTKDFKFRLISRTTGKAIDLNVNYGFKKMPAEQERDLGRGVYSPSQNLPENNSPSEDSG